LGVDAGMKKMPRGVFPKGKVGHAMAAGNEGNTYPDRGEGIVVGEGWSKTGPMNWEGKSK